jgi:hypothetical protein
LEGVNEGQNVQSEKTPDEALVGVGEEQGAAAIGLEEEGGEIDKGEVEMADEGQNEGRVRQTPREMVAVLEEEQRATVKGAQKGDDWGEIDNGEVEMADEGQNEGRERKTPGETLADLREEQRAAVKQAKRAEKKKRKNGRAQNAEAVKGSGSSGFPDVGDRPEQKGAPESVYEPILVWREVAAESTDGRARPGFFVGDVVAEIATLGSPAAAVPKERGSARDPLDGSGQARVKPNQAGLKVTMVWSSMTPSEVGAHFQGKPSAAEVTAIACKASAGSRGDRVCPLHSVLERGRERGPCRGDRAGRGPDEETRRSSRNDYARSGRAGCRKEL